MENNKEKFLEYLESTNVSAGIAKSVMKLFDEEKLLACNSYLEFEQMIIDVQPTTKKFITTICYVLSKYYEWLKDNSIIEHDMSEVIKSVDRNIVWEKAKSDKLKKFISHDDLEDLLHDVGMFELNALHYQTLIRCIYEGIYSDKMEVFDNLTASSISGNIVMLNDGTETYKMKIPQKLADDLIELAGINEWEMNHRNGSIQTREIAGLYPDSVFKFEAKRLQVNNGTLRYNYYQRLRKIFKEYLDYKIVPRHLYISGMMYRISVRLKAEGYTVEDAFKHSNKDHRVTEIIQMELDRCHCRLGTNRFREIVMDYLEVFM